MNVWEQQTIGRKWMKWGAIFALASALLAATRAPQTALSSLKQFEASSQQTWMSSEWSRAQRACERAACGVVVGGRSSENGAEILQAFVLHAASSDLLVVTHKRDRWIVVRAAADAPEGEKFIVARSLRVIEGEPLDLHVVRLQVRDLSARELGEQLSDTLSRLPTKINQGAWRTDDIMVSGQVRGRFRSVAANPAWTGGAPVTTVGLVKATTSPTASLRFQGVNIADLSKIEAHIESGELTLRWPRGAATARRSGCLAQQHFSLKSRPFGSNFWWSGRVSCHLVKPA